jgi:hypothetical protein
MTFDDLIAQFTDKQQLTLLSDWTWLVGEEKLPILLTATGNAILQSTANGSVHELDTVEGWIRPLCDSVEELHSHLNREEFVQEHFHQRRVSELRNAGMILEAGQVYSHKTPLALGGTDELNNIEATDLEVHFSVSGQIFEQVSALPEGTKISGIQAN